MAGVNKKIKSKSVLKPEIAERLLQSQAYMGIVADHVRTETQTIKRQILSQSPTLTLPIYQDAIRECLGLPSGTVIHDVISIGSPELTHE